MSTTLCEIKQSYLSIFDLNLFKTEAFFLCNNCASRRFIGCNSGDSGLEEDDEIHEKKSLPPSQPTTKEGGLDHRFSNGHLEARRDESFYICHQQTLLSP